VQFLFHGYGKEKERKKNKKKERERDKESVYPDTLLITIFAFFVTCDLKKKVYSHKNSMQRTHSWTQTHTYADEKVYTEYNAQVVTHREREYFFRCTLKLVLHGRLVWPVGRGFIKTNKNVIILARSYDFLILFSNF